ncbi:MAG TPA: ATP-dependent Clp protease proteolytic subunit [Devosia sp.]|jgi:ATP-dependent protease ClpP protease subunit|nr:ATP-dependent Clp protease proteolytic subunit [Devosia sp.]
MNNRDFLFNPNVRLFGEIGSGSFWDFMDQVAKVRETDNDAVVLELSTEGGDADVARRIACEIRLCRQWHGRETHFVGKTYVYSAGVTIMAAVPRENRYLTEDTVMLVHERRLTKTIQIDGPMRSNIQILREQLASVESAQQIEKDGFAELAEGSKISVDELYDRATRNCYLTAREALDLELIADII